MNSNVFQTSPYPFDPNSIGAQSLATSLGNIQAGTLPQAYSADPFTALGQGMQVPTTLPPQQGGAMNWLSNNAQGINAGIQGIQALFGMYQGLRGLSLAKDQFNFTRDAYNTNLKNSQTSYNTALEDRIRGRTSDYAGKEADVSAYLKKHSLGNGG